MEATGKASPEDAAISIVASMQEEGYDLNEQTAIVRNIRGLLRDEIDAEISREQKAFEDKKKEFTDLKNAI